MLIKNNKLKFAGTVKSIKGSFSLLQFKWDDKNFDIFYSMMTKWILLSTKSGLLKVTVVDTRHLVLVKEDK